MSIYTVFNSRKELLATFSDMEELFRYIWRHKRDKNDTTIIKTELNSWHEFFTPENLTEVICEQAYKHIN